MRVAGIIGSGGIACLGVAATILSSVEARLDLRKWLQTAPAERAERLAPSSPACPFGEPRCGAAETRSLPPVFRLRPNAVAERGAVLPAFETPAGLLIFRHAGNRLDAVAGDRILWSEPDATGAAIVPISDVDGDGHPEVLVTEAQRSPASMCGTAATNQSRIRIFNGRTGVQLVSAIAANCASSLASPIVYTQLSANSVLLGPGSLFVSQQYAETGVGYIARERNWLRAGQAILPGAPQFGASYVNTRKSGMGTEHVAGSHVANGLVLAIPGEDRRIVAFTTGRVLQYAIPAAGAEKLPLISDTPFLAHRSATDDFNDEGSPACFDGCRNYGLVVALQVGDRRKVALVAGTRSSTLATDTLLGQRGADVWGGITRHLTVFDPLRQRIDMSRYYGYAHDPEGSTRHKYAGRVTYPANPKVVVAGRTFLLFNVYNAVRSRSDRGGDQRWYVSVNRLDPDGRVSETRLYDRYLWDVAGDDGALDGSRHVLVYSETDSYWPRRQDGQPSTQLGLLRPDGSGIDEQLRVAGLPMFLNGVRREDVTDSSGSLAPVAIDAHGVVVRQVVDIRPAL